MVKVLPSEYRRVLAEQAKMPETAGRPAEAAPPRPYHSWREDENVFALRKAVH